MLRRVWPDRLWTHFRNGFQVGMFRPPYPSLLYSSLCKGGHPGCLALPAYLQSYLANLVTTGVRLIPLGQTDGTGLRSRGIRQRILTTSAQARNATV